MILAVRMINMNWQPTLNPNDLTLARQSFLHPMFKEGIWPVCPASDPSELKSMLNLRNLLLLEWHSNRRGLLSYLGYQ